LPPIRKGTPADLAAVRRILDQVPEAANWLPANEPFLVAELDGVLAGFLVWRRIAPDEIEILNLAVATSFRRQGIAKALLSAVPQAGIFLEVRASNLPARALYRSAGFTEIGIRKAYYQNPAEGAIVMRWQS
jgi:ribosomal-protein-alanine N-acetyltransferase